VKFPGPTRHRAAYPLIAFVPDPAESGLGATMAATAATMVGSVTTVATMAAGTTIGTPIAAIGPIGTIIRATRHQPTRRQLSKGKIVRQNRHFQRFSAANFACQ
jgi:hypothetical protein